MIKRTLTNNKTSQKSARPADIQDPPHLTPLDFVTDDRKEFRKNYPEIINAVYNYGKILFCLSQANRYHQITFGISWQARHLLWLFGSVVASIVNVQVAKVAIDLILPSDFLPLKVLLTVVFGVALILLLDLMIGFQLTNSLSSFNSRQTKEELESKLKSSKEELDIAFIQSQIDVFKIVENRYLSRITWFSFLILSLLIIVYLLEIAAAIYSVYSYDESDSLVAYLTPFLGVALSVMTALFRALKIEYSERKQSICHRYCEIAKKNHKQILFDISLANENAEYFLRDGKIDRGVVERIKKDAMQVKERESYYEKIDRLSERYHQRSQKITEHHEKSLKALEAAEETRRSNDLAVQDRSAKILKFESEKYHQKRQHLIKQIDLVETTQRQIEQLDREYPNHADRNSQLRRDLAAKHLEFQDLLSRLDLEWQLKNAPESDRPPNDLNGRKFDRESGDV